MLTRTTRRHASDSGFTVVELMTVVVVFAILAAMAVPQMKNMTDGMKLGQSAREVERELQTARLRAVTTSRPMRMRFGCPTAKEYRMVELLGSPSQPTANDSAVSRCQESTYPAAPPDNNPLTVPNHDGPVRKLDPSVSFGATKTLEFWPDGSVHADAGIGTPWPVLPVGGTAITLTRDSAIKTITVNGLGKIQLQ